MGVVSLAGELLLHVLKHPAVRAAALHAAQEAGRQMIRYLVERKSPRSRGVRPH